MTSRISRLIAKHGAAALLAGLTPGLRAVLRYRWRAWARETVARPAPSWLRSPPGHGVWGGQMAPPGDWTTWLYLAGRASGKTRAGAEWARSVAAEHPGARIAIVGATSADARRTMLKGKSGILRVCPPWDMPRWYHTDQTLTWANGSMATLYTADEPERLRGPEHDFAWADELCAWGYPEAWDMLLMTMRGGDRPRVLVTTTPKPSSIIQDLMRQPTTAITIGATMENAQNLPASFLTKIVAKYAGTHLGRQELEGEVVVETEGALWTRALVEQARVEKAPPLKRVVVAVDPSGSRRPGAALCGIVVAGIAEDDHVYILEDASEAMSPDAWARRVAVAHDAHKADAVLAESNHGGAMVEAVLGTVGLVVRLVNASRGKYVRAEPVAALYEQGRVHHVGAMPHLEDQMCSWTPESKSSPDRMDALVYAVTDLALDCGGLEYAGTIG